MTKSLFLQLKTEVEFFIKYIKKQFQLNHEAKQNFIKLLTIILLCEFWNFP